MRSILLWVGVGFYGVGTALILANVVMSYRGVFTSYDLSHLTRSQLSLVPLWQLGLVIAVIGVACLIIWRRIVR